MLVELKNALEEEFADIQTGEIHNKVSEEERGRGATGTLRQW